MRRKNKKRLINNPSQNIGHWSEIEHKTYLNFLMANKTIMESQDMKKTSKIFKLMSEIIGTRNYFFLIRITYSNPKAFHSKTQKNFEVVDAFII